MKAGEALWGSQPGRKRPAARPLGLEKIIEP